MAKNPKMVTCRNCNTAIAANVKKCPACGAKNKKPFYLRGWFVLLVILAVISGIGTIRRKSAEKEEKANEYRWPDSELAGLLPKPDSIYGRIRSDSERMLNIDIYKISANEFEDYVDSCKKNGFTVDYSRSDSRYSADNETGHSLMLTYDDKEDEMGISLYAPSDTSEISEESEESSSASPAENTQDDSEQSEITGDNEEGSTADGTEEPESAEEDNGSGLADGLRPEFKEAMDSYEAFYDEYCEFMKQYDENSTDTAFLKKYTELLSKMQEMNEKFEAWEGGMNDDELKYYTEVHVRIYQKLLDVSTE